MPLLSLSASIRPQSTTSSCFQLHGSVPAWAGCQPFHRRHDRVCCGRHQDSAAAEAVAAAAAAAAAEAAAASAAAAVTLILDGAARGTGVESELRRVAEERGETMEVVAAEARPAAEGYVTAAEAEQGYVTEAEGDGEDDTEGWAPLSHRRRSRTRLSPHQPSPLWQQLSPHQQRAVALSAGSEAGGSGATGALGGEAAARGGVLRRAARPLGRAAGWAWSFLTEESEEEGEEEQGPEGSGADALTRTLALALTLTLTLTLILTTDPNPNPNPDPDPDH